MSTHTLSDAVTDRSHLIETALREAIHFDAGCPHRLREAIEHSLLAPGKRLRPRLVLMACEVCGGQPESALPAAVAVEMIHAYSLVHDDLPAMDDDDLRRGRPTCHKQFDEATAILVGDALQARAFEVVATQIQPADLAARCCAALASAAGASNLVGGQADDLANEFNQCNVDQIEAIHLRKTGALFRVSLKLGALIAEATPDQIQALEVYGRHLGLAFQVVDDLLDVSGSEGDMGKRLGKDNRRGKNTYPAILGLEATRQLAEDLVDRACEALNCFDESAQPLRDVAIYVRQRNS